MNPNATRCPNCEEPCDAHQRFCRQCGASLQKRGAWSLPRSVIVPVVAILSVVVVAGLTIFLRSERLPTLSSQTTGVVGQLKEQIKIVQFSASSDDAVDGLFRAYQAVNPDKISYIIVDPSRAADLAKQYNVSNVPITVVQSIATGRVMEVQAVDEKSLTNAIVRAVAPPKVLYFTKGHAEVDLKDGGRQSYSMLSEELVKDNYLVRTLDLTNAAAIPQDAAAVVIAGPKSPFQAAEREQIARYVEGGGKLLVLQDPAVPPALEDVLLRWNVGIVNDIVVDVSGLSQPTVALIGNYEPHPITNGFKAVTMFPVVRSLRVLSDSKNGFSSEAFLRTSDRTWGETRYPGTKGGSDQVVFDEREDTKGPLSVGVVSSRNRAAVVVIGDSDFVVNAYIGMQGNKDLMLRIVNWLARESIDP